jgi:hypothetical protein
VIMRETFMQIKKLLILFVLLSACTSSFAQTPVVQSNFSNPDAAVADDPQPPAVPQFACQDDWKEVDEGGKKVLRLFCKTGYCGAGGTGETCESTGKDKDGKPTCQCVVKKEEPPATDNGRCLGRPQCGGACTTKKGRQGTCRVRNIPYVGPLCVCG